MNQPSLFDRRRKQTHGQQIEIMLRDAGSRGVCATTFLGNYMPTYSQRIGELKRRKGLNITTARCADPNHAHKSRQIRYFLEL